MTANRGWIKAHRSWLSDPLITKSPEHLAVWIYLQLSATHKEIPVLFGRDKIILRPGQVITGREAVAKAIGGKGKGLKKLESKVRRVLDDFESGRLIDQQTNSKGRLISILNWEQEQKSDQHFDQQFDHQLASNKNIKNYGEDNTDAHQRSGHIYIDPLT